MPALDRICGKTGHGRARLFLAGLVAAALIATADLASKWAMVAVVMDPPRVIPVAPFFNLILGFNRGVSFGLLDDLGPWGPFVLSCLALGIIGLLVVWLRRTEHLDEAVGISMIVGGAMGNLIDRLDDGAVTDFLDFYVNSHHWPAFNLADTAISLGVAVLIFGAFRKPQDPEAVKA
jgi:signal peptidase II